MSAIATFYLVRKEDVPRLKEVAAIPARRKTRRFLFFEWAKGEWDNPYWDFLRTQTQELEKFSWSGRVIGSEVYLYLASRNACIDSFCDPQLSDYLLNVTDECVFPFTHAGARQLVEQMEANWPDERVLSEFLSAEDMRVPGEEEVVPTEAVLDGLTTLKCWLAQVGANQIGLLYVG